MTIMTQPAGSEQSLNPLQMLRDQQRNKKLLAWANQQYNRMKNDRLATEREWYMNLAFFFGKHYAQLLSSPVTSSGFALQTPKAPPWRVRMVVNKIRPIARHEMSRLTSSKPTFTVVPATTEDEDYAAARAGEAIFTAVYQKLNIEREIKRAVWWQVNVGTGYLKCYWDQTKTDVDSNQKGDFCVDRVSPFEIYVPDLTEEELENQQFVFHVTTKTKEYVKNYYGLEVNENSAAVNDPLEDSFLNLVGAAQQSKRKTVLVMECWIKSGVLPEFPEGGLFTVVGDKVYIGSKTYPYKHGEFPFYKLDGIPTGKFYADSIITDLRPLQREYNRTKSQIIEAKNLMAKPRLIAPRGSVNARQITSEPGQVIQYTPGFNPPTPLPMDNLPPYVTQELDRLQQDMDDISAQHEITRGHSPAQVTAATAISYLQEQDDSKLAYQISSIEYAVQKLGRHILKLVTQYWTTDRLVRVVGDDNAFEAQRYAASDLKGNTDLRVEAGSALPKSKAARQAMVMDLIKLGLIQPQQGLEMLDIGGVEKIYEDYLVDKRQAQRENLKMASIDPMLLMQTMQPQVDPQTGQQMMPDPQALSQVVPVNTWDNHAAHVQFHNQFRKTQEFEMLPDPVKQLFEQHVNLHKYTMTSGFAPMGPMGTPMPQLDGPVPPQGGPQGGPPVGAPQGPGGPAPQGPPVSDPQQQPPGVPNG